MSIAPRQLALALDHAESFAREDFLSGPSNAMGLALIDAWPAWPHRTVMLTGPLVVEDVAAGAFDERALFHLLNLAREDEAFVLLTARVAPVTFAIRDLGSRLNAIPVVAMAPPDDALLRAVLVKLFADRQLAVDESLIGYVATRIERSFAAARAAVARLDEEAMRRKRPLTRTFAAEILRVTEP